MKTADLYRISDAIGTLILTTAAVVFGLCCATAWIIWRSA